MTNSIHSGDLFITHDNINDFVHVTRVEGYLTIYANGASLPALTSVGDYLQLEADGAGLPALTSVGGSLYIYANGASLPALTSVGGILYIKAGASFDYSRITFGAGKVIALCEYALHVNEEGLYRAGCHGPWTAEKALAHWSGAHKNQNRAKLFSAAIMEHETIRKAQA